MEHKEKLFDILHGKCTLPDAMKTFGFTKQEVDDSISAIKQADRHDSGHYFFSSLMLAQIAYQELVKLGEIDSTIVYTNQEPRLNDIGFKGDDMYRFTPNGWEKI